MTGTDVRFITESIIILRSLSYMCPVAREKTCMNSSGSAEVSFEEIAGGEDHMELRVLHMDEPPSPFAPSSSASSIMVWREYLSNPGFFATLTLSTELTKEFTRTVFPNEEALSM